MSRYIHIYIYSLFVISILVMYGMYKHIETKTYVHSFNVPIFRSTVKNNNYLMI